MGSPSAVVEAALAASRVAYQLIDMARHKGNIPTRNDDQHTNRDKTITKGGFIQVIVQRLCLLLAGARVTS